VAAEIPTLIAKIAVANVRFVMMTFCSEARSRGQPAWPDDRPSPAQRTLRAGTTFDRHAPLSLYATNGTKNSHEGFA
jgi:hypothetical protein